jgi:hypothetical protein
LRNANPYDILTDAFDMGDITDIADGYCEPGYTLPEGKKGVAFGDWNGKNYRLANILDRMGYEVEWLDEWTTCQHCYKAFRTQPDSYSWKMYGAFLENTCEMICGSCLADNPDWIIDEYINDPHRAITFNLDLAEAGWVEVDGDWRNGWYGQEDKPEEVVKQHVGVGQDFVFVIDSVGQFELAFKLWIREA